MGVIAWECVGVVALIDSITMCMCVSVRVGG